MFKDSFIARISSILAVICLVAVIVISDLLRSTPVAGLSLPPPSRLLALGEEYSLPFLKGLRLNHSDPFALDFIVDSADLDKVEQEHIQCLISYFLAGLTTPDEDLWVNLSPNESDRVLAPDLETTDLGRDMLAQDYVLKQLASSLTHPDTETGKAYWANAGVGAIRESPLQADESKIWIVPDKAEVYEQGTTAVITAASLKLQCEDESQQVLLSAITKDVNEGRNFANLRQIYHSLILAKWFKTKLKDSLYAAYIDQHKLKGINTSDPALKEKIFGLYVQSFKKGVYDVIRGAGANNHSPLQERRRFFPGAPCSANRWL